MSHRTLYALCWLIGAGCRGDMSLSSLLWAAIDLAVVYALFSLDWRDRRREAA